MKILSATRWATLTVVVFSVSSPAFAQSAGGGGMLDDVVDRFRTTASSWSATFTLHASILFGALAAISLIWTFGQMALRRADLGEFASEAIRFAIFCGLYWFLLSNGPAIANAIMDGLRQAGSSASGQPNNLSPSGIVDIGFEIFKTVTERSTALHPVDSAIAILFGISILIVLALVGVNMMLLLVSGYILSYAGIIYLGFGGSRWTSDIAINYFKTVVALGMSLLVMVVLVGIGKTFLDQYFAVTGSGGGNVQQLGTMLVFCVVLLALVNKVPHMVAGIINGGSIGAVGGSIGGFGAGAAAGAAGFAAGAMATGGGMISAGTMNAVGGASAIREAFAAVGGGSGEGGESGAMGDGQPLSSAGDLADGGDDNGGGGGGGGLTPLSAAMGGDGDTAPANDNNGGQDRSDAASAGRGASASAAANREPVDREDGESSASTASRTARANAGDGYTSSGSSADSSPPLTAQFSGDMISAARDRSDIETPEDEVAAFVQRRGDSHLI